MQRQKEPCLRHSVVRHGERSFESGTRCSKQEITLSYLNLVLVAERYAASPESGARHKAATLLRDCRAISSSRTSHHDALRKFMRRLDLFLADPPPSAPTSADRVLALHVELAYAYGLSALLKIRPHVAHSLAVDVNAGYLRGALIRPPDPQ
ncbi:uncharacterized protein LOC142774220 [Rhipicephalus microplus]|uniref:uncharacterized protein LOC142774220 n=1 Tax=Rhipicephalus microplus TaxID=6941 RepID=UPI003F6B291C